MRTLLWVLVSLVFSFSLSAVALGQSAAALDAKKNVIRELLAEIEHDSAEYEAAKKRAPEPDKSSGQFEPSEIAQIVARYKRDLRALQAEGQVISTYFEKRLSRLSELSELEQYLARFRRAREATDARGSEANQAVRELISVAEKMQQAYIRNDASDWNTLARQLPTLFETIDETARRARSAAAVGESIMEEVQDFLRQRVQLLDEEIASARKSEATPKAETKPKPEATSVARLSFEDLVNVFNEAAEKAWKPDTNAPGRPFPKGGRHAQMEKNCSQHFREIMRAIKRRGVDVGPDWTDEFCNANCLIKKIRQSRDWREVGESEVQKLANRANTAVGVAPGPTYGHIAIAFPISPDQDPSKILGTGPFIRDGNERYLKGERRFYASSWGAVKASHGPPHWLNAHPKWYVYVPLEKLNQ